MFDVVQLTTAKKKTRRKEEEENISAKRTALISDKTLGNADDRDKMKTFTLFLSVLAAVASLISAESIMIPCGEFHPKLAYPCRCGLNEINATIIDCDGAVFAEFPLLPYRFYIQEFSQRDAGLQTLGAQLFTASDLPLTRVDFSRNNIRRLTERLFDGVEDTLETIELGHNLLGDNLNPVFSSGEFQNLKFLRALDLSYNKLTKIEEGLLEGCNNLKVRIKVPAGIIILFKCSATYYRLLIWNSASRSREREIESELVSGSAGKEWKFQQTAILKTGMRCFVPVLLMLFCLKCDGQLVR